MIPSPFNIGAFLVAAFVLFGAYQVHIASKKSEAVNNERASVERQAKKKDDKAQANRRAAAADDPLRLLAKRGELRDEPKP